MRRLNPFRLFQVWNAVNLHFKPSARFDAIKYNFKFKCSEEKFESFKFKWFFERCSSRYQTMDEFIVFLAANLVNGGDFIHDLRNSAYDEDRIYFDSLTYSFKKDIKKIPEDFDNSDFNALRYDLGLSIQTILLLNSEFGFIDHQLENRENISPLILKAHINKLYPVSVATKYLKFRGIDRNRIHTLIQTHFCNANVNKKLHNKILQCHSKH